MWTRALLLAVIAVGAAGCGEDEPAAPAACADVPFAANSDNLAADIRASGLTCDAAREFIRTTDGAPAGGARGYACTSTRIEDALVHTRWRCTKGETVITWNRF